MTPSLLRTWEVIHAIGCVTSGEVPISVLEIALESRKKAVEENWEQQKARHLAEAKARMWSR